jgi:hypothetical protein
MADGEEKFQEIFNNKFRGFIAYQDEEHSLGHSIAKDISARLIEEYQELEANYRKNGVDYTPLYNEKFTPPRPSPRRTSQDVLSALVSHQAVKAVLPLQNDLRGYNKKTLEALIDFSAYKISGARLANDRYVLAVPSSQVMELGETAFPSSFKDRPYAVGNNPRNEEARNLLRNRIGRIYASADAMDRCGAALAGFEAQGIELSHIPDHANPYRMVLEEAHRSLDPDRIINTSYDEKTNTLERASRTTAKNYSKKIDAVLLPADSVYLGNKNNVDRTGPDFYDYVVVDTNLEGVMPMETNFLILDRKDALKVTAAQKRFLDSRKWKAWSNSVQGAYKKTYPPDEGLRHQYARILMKIDSRGKGVKDVGLFTKKLSDRGIPFTPIVLNDRPEELPIVFDIEVKDSPKSIEAITAFFRDIEKESAAWKTLMLGAYGTDMPMPASARTERDTDSWWEKVRKFFFPIVLVLAVALAGFSAWQYFFKSSDTGNTEGKTPSEPVVIAKTQEPTRSDTPPVALALGSKKNTEPATVSFNVVRSAPDNYWVCGNTSLVTSSRVEALCQGATSPETYAALANTAISTDLLAERLLLNSAVANRLCDAGALVVTGSASSSPYEKNESLPKSRASTWATALENQLGKTCATAPPVFPLSLGVAGCGTASVACSVDSDRPEDRQLMVLALTSAHVGTLDRSLIETELSGWLGSQNINNTSMPLLTRLTDPSVFDLNELVWTDNNQAVHISSASN